MRRRFEPPLEDFDARPFIEHARTRDEWREKELKNDFIEIALMQYDDMLADLREDVEVAHGYEIYVANEMMKKLQRDEIMEHTGYAGGRSYGEFVFTVL